MNFQKHHELLSQPNLPIYSKDSDSMLSIDKLGKALQSLNAFSRAKTKTIVLV